MFQTDRGNIAGNYEIHNGIGNYIALVRRCNKKFKYSRFHAITLEKSRYFFPAIIFGISKTWAQFNSNIKIYG